MYLFFFSFILAILFPLRLICAKFVNMQFVKLCFVFAAAYLGQVSPEKEVLNLNPGSTWLNKKK